MYEQKESKSHLETRIRMTEDELLRLRNRNPWEVERIQKNLMFLRRKLQRMQYES